MKNEPLSLSTLLISMPTVSIQARYSLSGFLSLYAPFPYSIPIL
jgi:hypothetical protein